MLRTQLEVPIKRWVRSNLRWRDIARVLGTRIRRGQQHAASRALRLALANAWRRKVKQWRKNQSLKH